MAAQVGADYHGRFLVELLQNASDQAAEASLATARSLSFALLTLSPCRTKAFHPTRSALRPEGSGYTRRSQFWAELKRLAPEKAAKLSYTKVSTEQLEPMVEEAKKAR
ncbi:MAG TPA: hypothetical protein VM223_22805 [Planctomycetota bacterium]|nr:hypothetical protein [Planctomycetota bacterium]